MKITETKGKDGWREIGIRADNGQLIAVITHPITGAKWFLHRMGENGKQPFKTKKAAIAAISS